MKLQVVKSKHPQTLEVYFTIYLKIYVMKFLEFLLSLLLNSQLLNKIIDCQLKSKDTSSHSFVIGPVGSTRNQEPGTNPVKQKDPKTDQNRSKIK